MIDENTLESFANLFKDERQLEKDYQRERENPRSSEVG